MLKKYIDKKELYEDKEIPDESVSITLLKGDFTLLLSIIDIRKCNSYEKLELFSDLLEIKEDMEEGE